MNEFLCMVDADGGFTVGDCATGVTAYAYPSSHHAANGKRSPLATGRYMLAREIAFQSKLPAGHIFAQRNR